MIRHPATRLAALLSTFCIVSGIMLIPNLAVVEFQILEMGGTVAIRDKIMSYYMPAICVVLGVVLQVVTFKIYED